MVASSQAFASSVVLSENWQQLSGTSWSDGSGHGVWNSVYNGYGANGIATDQSATSGSKVLSERPQASTSADETHAGLVVTKAAYGDFDMSVKVRTVAQLRRPTPNPWETAWVLWHYTDDTHFYSVVLKPNGWELGKEDPAYAGAQRYLRTGSSPSFPVGQWYTVRVRQQGSSITVWVNGAKLTSFVDNQRPYLSGATGLYNEDSEVHFDLVRVATI